MGEPGDSWDDEWDKNPPRVQRNKNHRCVCGDDLPGTCPGVTNCPYSGEGEEDVPET